MANKFEQMFDAGYEKYLAESFVLIKQQDLPTFRKTIWMLDRYLISRNISIAVELKSCKDDRFSTERLERRSDKKMITPRKGVMSQLERLTEFDQKVGNGFLLVGFDDLGSAHLIPIRYVIERMKVQKSFRIKDLDSSCIQIPIDGNHLDLSVFKRMFDEVNSSER